MSVNENTLRLFYILREWAKQKEALATTDDTFLLASVDFLERKIMAKVREIDRQLNDLRRLTDPLG